MKPAKPKKEKIKTARTARESISKAPGKPRQTPPLTKSRQALLAAYAAAYEAIPLECVCPACGLPAQREQLERHHPSGRRKAAFLFTVQIHRTCHLRTHADPRWAEDHGLLWRGRNSREFTAEAAEQLIAKQPFPATYAVAIWKDFSLTKP